jgi:uracil-DNA glycosylase family 4
MSDTPQPLDATHPAQALEALAGAFRAYVEWAALTGAEDWPLEPAPERPQQRPAARSPSAPVERPPVRERPPSVPRMPAVEPRAQTRETPPPARRKHPAESAASLESIRAEIVPSCRRCGLCEGRRHVVFGAGLASASVMVVGGAPGHDDDVTAEAWVGVQGRLLTRMLRAIGVERGAAFLTHVVKCRPPHRRDPTPDEVARCRPFLERQLQAIAPDAILALGPLAAAVITGSDAPFAELRGRVHEVSGTPVIVSFDPAWLLTEPLMKRHAWDDLLALRTVLQQRSAP